MPTIKITIEVPEGADVSVDHESDKPDAELTPTVGTVSSLRVPGSVARYWRSYLSDNGRALYGAAAAIERRDGPGYTLEDIAVEMGKGYSSAQSIHRTTGRSARRWKNENRLDAPVRLEWIEYQWDESKKGMRTHYQLPSGVADEIAAL